LKVAHYSYVVSTKKAKVQSYHASELKKVLDLQSKVITILSNDNAF